MCGERHDALAGAALGLALVGHLGLGVQRVTVEQRLGNATSPKPRLPTMVPCVSCATDSPTSVDSVNIEFTSRWLNGGNASANAASRCSAWVFIVSVVNRHVVGLGDGAARPVLIQHSGLELLEPQPALDDDPSSYALTDPPPARSASAALPLSPRRFRGSCCRGSAARPGTRS